MRGSKTTSVPLAVRPPLAKPQTSPRHEHRPREEEPDSAGVEGGDDGPADDVVSGTLDDAELDAVEAGRRLAEEQQQRLLRKQSENSANRCQRSGAAVDDVRKSLLHTTAALDKERARVKELSLSLSTAQTELAAMKRELAVVHRVSGPGGAGVQAVSAQAKELATVKRQLQLAQNETEVVRQQLAAGGAGASKTIAGDAAGAAAATLETAKLRNDVRSLESQRAELLNVVKKQNRLIDVLRRQKMHLEAAKLLQITEEEFRRALLPDARS